MNITQFGRLAIGEKFRLPDSTLLLVKETKREESVFGWVNASYDNPYQGQPSYFSDDTSVIRQRHHKEPEARRKSQPFQYQCIECQNWVEENEAAMSKGGVMCLTCYARALQAKHQGDEPSSPLLPRPTSTP